MGSIESQGCRLSEPATVRSLCVRTACARGQDRSCHLQEPVQNKGSLFKN